MSPTDVTTLLLQLSERDISILQSISTHRLLSTAHIRRLHFAQGHASLGAASGAVMRVLTRLEAKTLVARLGRRIGGVRAGSSGITWQLGATGERLIRTMEGKKYRRRFIEPGATFAAHTLATAELAVSLHELDQAGVLEVTATETEPSCWRSFAGPHGTLEWLKPDLFTITVIGDFEDHWYVEADLATEHPTVVLRKAKTYQRYAATGAHQARHGLFPAVVWVVPDSTRQRALQAALAADKAIQPGLFQVVTTSEFRQLITSGVPDPPAVSEADHQHQQLILKGGTT
ncbi:replication-relaxation family protein [Amycolatopsis sp. OK19-0408]|uniref:Replication-relaxation family protein n=1 Tax=Amycolatopsis iheyensis TaxID=2945988 RepID=A0A9X2NBL8_9PSEU|nr:replication-relaxation family protein [Amycolatopsis iheyensis]MCR6484040.1 replication-relaxation family protein [Amycolatopsis iheyensis]